MKTVISASRRTDIPAKYMGWFMDCWKAGFVDVINPVNRRTHRVNLAPETVHSIVFWSKDIRPVMDQNRDMLFLKSGVGLYFNLTVNATSPDLEPGVPPLAARLEGVEQITLRHGPETVNWRFDPICKWRDKTGATCFNINGFVDIAANMASFGISRCTTSFMTPYQKTIARGHARGIEFLPFSLSEKKAILSHMTTVLSHHNIQLFLCCDADLLNELPPDSGILKGACVPGEKLKECFGPGISMARDAGQRPGCGCTRSRDIGMYDQHPCSHGCVYCYARPVFHEQKPRK